MATIPDRLSECESDLSDGSDRYHDEKIDNDVIISVDGGLDMTRKPTQLDTYSPVYCTNKRVDCDSDGDDSECIRERFVPKRAKTFDSARNVNYNHDEDKVKGSNQLVENIEKLNDRHDNSIRVQSQDPSVPTAEGNTVRQAQRTNNNSSNNVKKTSFSVSDILDPHKFVGCGSQRVWHPWSRDEGVRDYSKSNLDREQAEICEHKGK